MKGSGGSDAWLARADRSEGGSKRAAERCPESKIRCIILQRLRDRKTRNHGDAEDAERSRKRRNFLTNLIFPRARPSLGVSVVPWFRI